MDKVTTQQQRIKKLIVYLGEEGPDNFKRDINKLITNLNDQFVLDNTQMNSFIISNLAKCIGLLSDKIQLFATVFGLIRNKNQTISEKVLEKVMENMQNAFDIGDTIIAKNYLLFLGELVNIGAINNFSFITLLHQIINEAEKTLDSSQDYYLQIIIQSLPHFYEILMEKSDFEFQSLIESLKQLMNRRKQQILKFYRFTQDEIVQDWLSLFFQAIFRDINKNNNSFMLKNKVSFEFQSQFQNMKQITQSLKITFSNKIDKQCVQISHQMKYFLNNLQQFDELCELEVLFLVRQLQEMIQLLKQNKKLLLSKILNVHVQIESQEKQQQMLVKVILQALFNEIVLSNKLGQNKLIIYSSIFCQLVESQTENDIFNQFKLNLNKIFDEIFMNIDQYNYSFEDKINVIMSHFLSNSIELFDFSSLCQNYQNHSKRQKMFLQKLLTKTFKLLNFERIQDLDIIPKILINNYYQNFQKIDEKPFKCKYLDQQGSMCQTDAEIIMDQMNQKIVDDEMRQFLINSAVNNIDATGEDLNCIFIDCFLVKTSNSLTHLKTLSERYRNTLKLIILNKDSYQINFLNDLQSFWQGKLIPIRNCIQKFISWNILKKQNVINWIFKQFDKEQDINYELFSNLMDIFDNVLLIMFSHELNEEEEYQIAKHIVRKFCQSIINNNEEKKQSIIENYFREFLINYDDQLKQYGSKIMEEIEEINLNMNQVLVTLLKNLKQIYSQN